ncbi:hypothetical protein M569_06836 [Genlisea aurea]|uniref:SHSP domain-containing protein n=1 Tax=Genlisea aurea TaxID=192259 RepID=S8DXD0_9LAMI|nr:hypothetical protein M569_06836 [Genlisea aurea]
MAAYIELFDNEAGTFDSLDSFHYGRKETPENYVIAITGIGPTKKGLVVKVCEMVSCNPCLEITAKYENGAEKFGTLIDLAENANLDEAVADLKDGVLTITVPKSEGKAPTKAKGREIEISE